MEENKFTREIIDFDFKGLGMTKVDGLPVFLDGGVIGDQVEFLITKKKKNFCKGKILNTIKKSKDRVKSPCPYFEDCGGCDFLNYSDDMELKWKEDDTNKNLEKIAGLDNKVDEVFDSPEKTHYRNNMQFQVRDGVIDFMAKIPRTYCKNCLMQREKQTKSTNNVAIQN
ncbi:MAG: hypothetical protein ACLU1X_02400 [Peptoniphilus grossensis]